MCAVACDASLTVADAIMRDQRTARVKSLVNVEFDGPVALYRLSESTRAYALSTTAAKASAGPAGAARAICRSASSRTHAQTRGQQRGSRRRLAAALKHTLDDARHAYDWAFSPDGDVQLGIELASDRTVAPPARTAA